MLPEEKVEALRVAQSNILGPRTPQRSEKIAYEDNWRAESVKVGQRCYGLSLTVEAPRVAGAPAASAKMSDSMKLDEHQLMRKELVTVRTSKNSAIATDAYHRL